MTYPYPLAQPDAEACARSLCNARYQPMDNFYAERVIGSVRSSLRTCVQDVELEWDKLIDKVMMAFRSTPDSATGFSFHGP